MNLDKRITDERFDVLEQKIEEHDTRLAGHIMEFRAHVDDFRDHVVTEEGQRKEWTEAIQNLVKINQEQLEAVKVWVDIYTTTGKLRKFVIWLGGFSMFAGVIAWFNIK